MVQQGRKQVWRVHSRTKVRQQGTSGEGATRLCSPSFPTARRFCFRFFRRRRGARFCRRWFCRFVDELSWSKCRLVLELGLRMERGERRICSRGVRSILILVPSCCFDHLGYIDSHTTAAGPYHHVGIPPTCLCGSGSEIVLKVVVEVLVVAG